MPGVTDEDVTAAGSFEDAPITASDMRTLPVLADASAEVEDVEVFVSSLSRASASGPYAWLMAQNERATPFTTAPAPETRAEALFPALPEMSAEIWQAGVRALVTVPETVDPPWLDDDYWRDLGGLLMDELALDEDPARRLELTMSAARVSERLGDGGMALRLVDEALALAPDAPEAWRARGRLLEDAGDLDGAHEAWRQLGARIVDPEEREVYAALDGEWTLARRGALDGRAGEPGLPSLASIPDGPARALAEAELALLRGTPSAVAGALEQAGFGTGGAAGAALLEASARFHEVGGDAAAAAEQRFVAARMDAGNAGPPLGRLRDAARLPPAEAEVVLAEAPRRARADGARRRHRARLGGARARAR